MTGSISHPIRRRAAALTATATLLVAPLGLGVLVAGAALAEDATVTVSPTTLVFPDTFVGTASDMRSVVLTNVSGATLTLSLAGGALLDRTDFHSDGQTCGALPPGGSCAFRYHFAPTKPGTLSDHTTIGVNGTNYAITVTGKGIPGFAVAPTTLQFPDTIVGSISGIRSVLLTNISDATLHPSLAGGALLDRTDFGDDGQTCGAVPPGGTCAFRYHFAPTKVGVLTDHTTIGVDGTNYPITVTGRGITGVDVTPTTLTFPDTPVGELSAPLDVALTNVSSQVLHPGIGGGSLASGIDFVFDGENCPDTLTPGQACQATYQFHPQTAGRRTDTATLMVAGSPVTITLVGGHDTATTTASDTTTAHTTATHTAATHTTATHTTHAATTHHGTTGTPGAAGQAAFGSDVTTPAPGSGASAASGPVQPGASAAGRSPNPSGSTAASAVGLRAAGSDDGGGSAWPYLWIAIGVLAAAGLGAVAVVLARRRRARPAGGAVR